MSYFTTDVYETKREIVNFTKDITEGLRKAERKFVMDMLFGIARSQNVLLTDISRSLEESTKLINTVDRLSHHLEHMNKDNLDIIKNNFYHKVQKHLDEEPLILMDDSEIIKKYGKKFEDLCQVRDASSLKNDIYPGYHVCEACVVTRNEKQPISLYSHIYSTASNGFKSMNNETLKSIKAVKDIIIRKCTFVFDRGYDANVYYDYFLNDGCHDDFIIRLKENRNLLFKGKSKNAGEIIRNRKGKIKMNMYFSKKNAEVYVSHTRVQLPNHANQELTLVMVYGLSDEKPMMLLTNKKIQNKEGVHKAVRAYMSRWRIEEGFRFKKQQYKFENMRVRSLKAMNVLNTLLMIHIGQIGILAENINRKLLVIKIIERSKAIKSKRYMWYYQISTGIKKILEYTTKGIELYKEIRHQGNYKQMQMKL